jgi:hypothetical protein
MTSTILKEALKERKKGGVNKITTTPRYVMVLGGD